MLLSSKIRQSNYPFLRNSLRVQVTAKYSAGIMYMLTDILSSLFFFTPQIMVHNTTLGKQKHYQSWKKTPKRKKVTKGSTRGWFFLNLGGNSAFYPQFEKNPFYEPRSVNHILTPLHFFFFFFKLTLHHSRKHKKALITGQRWQWTKEKKLLQRNDVLRGLWSIRDRQVKLGILLNSLKKTLKAKLKAGLTEEPCKEKKNWLNSYKF